MNGMMKKAGLAVALAATALTATAPAQAQRWEGRGYEHEGGDAAGAAVLGGLLGLGVGAAIASNHRGYYYGGPGYYAPPRPVYRGYYEDDYYQPRCWTQWRWDPYWGRNVRVRVCN